MSLRRFFLYWILAVLAGAAIGHIAGTVAAVRHLQAGKHFVPQSEARR